MHFTDSQLQRCFENNLAAATGFPSELRQIQALIATCEVFQMFEGPHAARVHEIIERLLLPELRPLLRQWYQRTGANDGPAEIGLRDRLSQLAGERLEKATENPEAS